MAGEFDLKDVLPWGRSRAEYCAFFALDAIAPDARILDCAGGPASFNAEMTQANRRVVSVDPLYRYSAAEIASRVEETRAQMLAGLRVARHRFVLGWHGSIERHQRIRMGAVRRFLDDFDDGTRDGRYRIAALPYLPFADNAFDLALSSHFLFLYSGHFDADAHVACIAEMLRVAPEARIFPLLDLDGNPSQHLDPAVTTLRARGYDTAVEPVEYEFQKGGDRMLRVARDG